MFGKPTMEIDTSEEGDSRNHEALQKLIAKGPLPTSLAKLSGSSRIIPSEKDFHFYNNFQEFKNPVKEIDFKTKNLLQKVGASENLFGKPIMFPGDEKIELDDDVGIDWLENVNDDIYEKFGLSLDEFKVLRKKEEESGVRKMRFNVDDDSENGFQMVYGKKNKNFLGLDRNMEVGGMKEVQEVKVAAKVRPKVSFHIPTIPRPQDEYKIIVNNLNQPFEHVWMERSADGSTLTHPLEKCSVLDFVTDSNSIVEPVKPPPVELTPFKLVDELNDLKRLAVKLQSVKEFAVDLEHNQYRSFQGLTCLMQISTRTEDFVIDTLKLRIYIGPHLRDVFKDPTKRKVMHGADRDIFWLQRDFGIYVCNMFDTGQASRVLKMERNSLEYLLNHFCGVAANKEYQNADWRLRPLPHEMIRYAREDTHYLLYIYDLMRRKLLMSSAESESSDPPLIEVYKRSYDICAQLYEKELLTDTSYLYIYGIQDVELNSKQLAIVSGLFEWRDIVARTEDESTGYVLPNRTLIEIAKQMPLTTSKLRQVLKSKHPYIERNLGSVVSIIKQCIQNASAFEEVAEYLKERRLEVATEQNAMATEESDILPPEAPEIMKTHKEVENIKYSNLPNYHINATSMASVQDENESQEIGISNARISTTLLGFGHCSHGKNGNEKSKIDGCIANSQKETLPEPEHSMNTHANANVPQMAEAIVQVLKKPSRAFGALFGNSAKKYDPHKREQEDSKLEQIKSSVSLPFHKFLGRDDELQSDIQESAKILEVSHHIEDVAAPAIGSTLEDIISIGDDSGVEESEKCDSIAASTDQLKQQENDKAGSASDIEEGDEPMSLSDLSSSFQECFPTLEQCKSSKMVEKSQVSEGFLQVKPFDYEAARKQVKFGGSCKTETIEASDDNDNCRSKRGDRKKSSVMFRSQKDEETTELPQGRRRQAFPASGNRSATFR